MYGDAVTLITSEMLQGLSMAIVRLLIAVGIVVLMTAIANVGRYGFTLVKVCAILAYIVVVSWGLWS